MTVQKKNRNKYGINLKTVILCLVLLALVLITPMLIEGDSGTFLRWWFMLILMGIGFYPLTRLLFSGFEDHGWIFSKALGVGLGGFLCWALIVCGAAKFRPVYLYVITGAAMAVCWIICGVKCKKIGKSQKISKPNLDLILVEEIIFFVVFLLWTYIAGFRPEALSTEKFMDYGFMASMMRSDTLPAKDMWYGTEVMNYYYGGQYYAVYLTKLTFTKVQQTYNLMRTMVAGLCFAMPFSLVRQMLRDLRKKKPLKQGVALLGGALAGGAVSLAGNMHYVLYGLFGKVFKLSGYESYWFPSSTRYIGHNPVTNDQCIHEFPSYSFVLGDLHAHMVNLFLVILLIGILYAWVRKMRTELPKAEKRSLKWALLQPHLLAAGVLIGIFQWTNFWDFIIYFAATAVFVLVTCVVIWPGKPLKRLLYGVLQLVEIFAVAKLAGLPFTMKFQSIVMDDSPIKLAKNHSALYQLVVLWGLPVLLVLILTLAVLITVNRSMKGKHRFIRFFRKVKTPDLFAVILGIGGILLVLIPEIVYVRDIYEEGFARSNTMFKLTYQAYVCFAICMAYGIMRLLLWTGEKVLRVLGGIHLGLLLLTCLYFGYAVNCWYGNITKQKEYRCLDATAYVVNTFPEDAQAIKWLQENMDGLPMVLEADGNSYSTYCRVSAMTGLPTLVGWYVHEWLWRNNIQEMNDRIMDVFVIYTSSDPDTTRELLEKYDVSYIFVGSCEREKYPDLNESVLQSMGQIVFGDTNGTYIIQVDKN